MIVIREIEMNNKMAIVKTTSLVNVKQIKGEFSIYSWRSKDYYFMDNRYNYLSKKVLYFMQLTYIDMKKYKNIYVSNDWHLTINQILQFIENCKDIPIKYKPAIKNITKMRGNVRPYKLGLKKEVKRLKVRIYWRRKNNFHVVDLEKQLKKIKRQIKSFRKEEFDDEVCEIVFKSQLILLMEQKNLQPIIVAFFKELDKTTRNEI